ncbi:excalibur calcium-binding domain-containing protein [Streptomyces sp. B15]|uniref:excalibur calcium-binding domain-containing protein n=1 Tax=Streptomyces sp. B15 TaxID=1537797 RepID=UPI0027DD5035|nr:excalibur calcium-binding domain-containing protein [Streptomyces sp. B15]
MLLAVIGSVVYVSCSGGDDTADAKPKAAEKAAQWRLDENSVAGSDATLWTDTEKSVRLKLLDGLSAEDAHSDALDDLDDREGLTAADVRITQLGVSHGVVSPPRRDGTALFTPDSGFEGEATVTYRVQLKGRPETVRGNATVTVELSPGGRYERGYDNCAEARADGAAPVRRGDPGYGEHLDRDGDGTGCDRG